MSEHEGHHKSCLRLRALTKFYGRTKVLDAVDLEVRQGELFTLLGPSGAGKSTVLACVTGLTPPDAGQVVLAGRDVTQSPIDQRNVGMVYQDYRLFPNLTARENVAFPLKARHRRTLLQMLLRRFRDNDQPAVTARVDEILSLLKLSQLGSRLPAQLSGGEQQRVAVGRAIVSSPALVCLDEPLSALDRSLRQQLQEDLRELQRRVEATMLYVTHDQTEAFLLADRIGILNQGRIEQVGTPGDLYDRPNSVFVAQFLGECNVFMVHSANDANSLIRIETSTGMVLYSTSRPTPALDFIGIRPERLRVGRPAGDGAFLLSGVIARRTFVSGSYRLSIRHESGICLSVVVSAADVQAETLVAGKSINLTYNPEDVLTLSGASTTPPTITSTDPHQNGDHP